MIDDPQQLLADSSQYLPIALKFSAIVSIIATPFLYTGVASASIVFPACWILIFAYTFYRAWQLNMQYLVSNDISAFKFIGGIALIAMTSAALFGGIVALSSPMADDPVWLIKAAFICNPISAIDAAVVATFGGYAIEKALALPSRRF
jgi:hypothetical protein